MDNSRNLLKRLELIHIEANKYFDELFKLTGAFEYSDKDLFITDPDAELIKENLEFIGIDIDGWITLENCYSQEIKYQFASLDGVNDKLALLQLMEEKTNKSVLHDIQDCDKLCENCSSELRKLCKIHD